jgi:transposase InsO family protein
MKKEIQKYTRTCKECQLKKLTRIKTKQPIVFTDTPGKAFDKISMDIMGPLPRTHTGNKYILTIQDLLTKYSLGIPIEGITAAEVAEAFVEQFICLFRLPRAILTVQGTNFTSALMKKVAKRFQIKQYIMTAYYPQSNGFIERSHHVLMKYLKLHIDIGTYHASLYEHLCPPRDKLLEVHSIFDLLIQRDTY